MVERREETGEDESGPEQEAGGNDSRETECSVLLTSVKSEHVKTFHCEGSCSVLEPLMASPYCIATFVCIILHLDPVTTTKKKDIPNYFS